MIGRQIKRKRTLASIPGALLANRARIHRSRLSEIENGHVQPTQEEVSRISAALKELVQARTRLVEVADEVGWPL